MKKRALIERGGQTILAAGARGIIRRSGTQIGGIENIPEGHPTVFAPFHYDWFDPFFYGAHLRKITRGIFVITAKEGLGKPPVGWVLGPLGCVFVNRYKKEGDSPQDRIAEIAAKYRGQANRMLRVPGNRGIAMNFPEGTRHPQLTMVRAGSLALAACIAEGYGQEVPMVPVGGAQADFKRVTRNIFHPPTGDNHASMHIGEPMWIGADLLHRYIEGGWEAVASETKELEARLADATNTARARVGLEPLEYVGKVETMKQRKRQAKVQGS